MEHENQPSEIRVSNWTLATGTRPGERHVVPNVQRDGAAPTVPDGRRG
jgi:hypothetical protein